MRQIWPKLNIEKQQSNYFEGLYKRLTNLKRQDGNSPLDISIYNLKEHIGLTHKAILQCTYPRSEESHSKKPMLYIEKASTTFKKKCTIYETW